MTAIGIGVAIFTGSRKQGATAPSIPANVSIPLISGPSPPKVGDTLTCSQGAWSGSPTPTFAYQWKRGVTNVGTNQNSYVCVSADVAGVITCQVTATNASGSASATSLGTLPVELAGAAPINTVAPVVSGATTVGSVLSCTQGTWSGVPTPTYTYQWQGNSVNIGGATANTFTLTSTQLGQTVRCVVTGTNINGVIPANSNSTVAITNPLAAPVNTVAPVASGTAIVGQTLSTTNGSWTGNPAPTFTYQWQSDGANIPSANAATYILTSAELGGVIHCIVTGTNSQGNSQGNSNNLGPVSAIPVAPINTVLPVLTGLAEVNETLAVTNGTWTGEPPPTYTRQWYSNSLPISGATGLTHVVQQASVGQTIYCTVTATNSQGVIPANSDVTAPVVPAVVTVAERLIGTEPNGLAIGFTDNSLLIRDTVTPANNFEGSIFPKLTFTRASVAFTTDVAGLLVSTAIDTPRFTYDPITHAALGVMIENAATNLCLQSQTIDAAAWTKDGVTITANAIAAPDGTLTADKMVQTAVNDAHRIIQYSFGIAGVGTTSFYAKAAELHLMCLRNTVTGLENVFNLLTGEITTDGNATCTMTDVGNGWWRITMTATSVGAANILIFNWDGVGNTPGFNPGDGVSGTYVWGVQFEQTDFVTSYIPAVAVAATRAIDLLAIASTLFNVGAGDFTAYAGYAPLISGGFPLLYFSGPANNFIYLQNRPDVTAVFANVVANNVTVADLRPTVNGLAYRQVAAGVALNDFAACINGAAPAVDAAGVVPVGLNNIGLGTSSSPTGFPSQNNRYAEFLHLPRRMTNAELQTLTTLVVT